MGFDFGSGRVEDIDNPDDHMTFIRLQWSRLAAYAWERYQQEGRGALIVDLRNASKSGAMLNVPTYYVAEGSQGLDKRGGWPSEEVAEVIRTYDPALDVVFIVLRLDGDFYHYNVSDQLTPPEAYARRGSS